MRTKRWELNLYAFYDHTGIERHLEKMAGKGWMLDRIGGLWRYHRIEPKRLRFGVAYYPDASSYDPIEPSENELTFWEYCAQAGWNKVAARAQMHVFCNEDSDAVPIETEAAVQVETLHRAAKREYLAGQWILIVMALFQLIRQLRTLPNDLADTLSSPAELNFILDFLLLLLFCSCELVGYYRWRHKAIRAAKELGRFTPTRSYPFYQGALTVTVLLTSVVCLRNNGRVFLIAAAYIVVLNMTVCGIRELLRRKNVDADTAKVTTVFASILIAIVSAVLLTSRTVSARLLDPPHADTAEPYEYTYSTAAGEKTSVEYAYHDPLPLYLEALTATDYDRYSCSRTLTSSPLVTRTKYAQEMRWGDGDSAPELFYTVYDVKLAPLFDACLQSLLTVRNPTSFYAFHFTSVDPTPWGADGAWRCCDALRGELPSDRWILTYGNRIVLWNPRDIPMEAAQMALVGSTFRP